MAGEWSHGFLAFDPPNQPGGDGHVPQSGGAEIDGPRVGSGCPPKVAVSRVEIAHTTSCGGIGHPHGHGVHRIRAADESVEAPSTCHQIHRLEGAHAREQIGVALGMSNGIAGPREARRGIGEGPFSERIIGARQCSTPPSNRLEASDAVDALCVTVSQMSPLGWCCGRRCSGRTDMLSSGSS